MTSRPAPPHEQTLLFAVFAGQVNEVRQMLESGAQPDGADGDLITPLMESVDELERTYDDERQEMTRLLLAAGAAIDRADEEGRTALHYAAGAGRRAVDLLVSAGAVVDVVDVRGRTPLHDAAERSCISAIEALRQAGAQLMQDHFGRTPSDLVDRSALDADELIRVDVALGRT